MKMKNTRKLSTVIIALAMCTLLVVTAWAANTANITYSATLDDSTLCVSDKDQTVTLTVKASGAVDMDSFTAQVTVPEVTVSEVTVSEVTVPEGLKLTAITNDTLNFTEDNFSLENGMILWYSTSGENVSNDLLATITITVPANTPVGEYVINFEIIDISKDYGKDVWETGTTVTATLTVSEHADGDGDGDTDHDCDNCGKANVDDGCNGGVNTCIAGAVCVECGTTYGSVDPNNHDLKTTDAKVPTCTEIGWDEYVTCQRDGCGHTTYVEKSATDHAWGEPTYTVNDDGTHTATYTCGNNASHTKSDEPAEHTYTDGKCVCGAEEPVININVVSKGVDTYTVEGNVVTVTYSIACKVGYWSETDGKYLAITAVANGDGSYSFTAPEGVTEVLLVVKGDTNLNGEVANNDVTLAKLAYLQRRTLSNEASFAADVSGNSIVNNQDVTQIKLDYQGKRALSW